MNDDQKNPEKILSDFEAELRTLLTQKLQYIQNEGIVYRALHEIIELLEKHKMPPKAKESSDTCEDDDCLAD